ncbi:MAG: zinc-binding alcohol dehydrogenase family protein [Paracoccaceae bacterium]
MTNQMKAVVVGAPGQIELVSRNLPDRMEGEVLIRIRRAGICGTDFHIYAGQHPFLTYPRLIGHELSGTVEAVQKGSAFVPGQIVTVIPYIACGICHACSQGKPNCCMAIAVLGVHKDGGMCEYLSVPESNVMAVEGLTLDEAATVEFLAIGAHAVRRAGDIKGRAVLVVGAGPIGLAVTIMAGIAGAAVTLADTDAARLALAGGTFPLTATLLADADFPPAVAAATKGVGFDVVFDATGNRASMERGFSLVAHGGTYVFAGLIKDDITFADSEFHKREITLMASRNATEADFAHVIASIRSGEVPADQLLTHRTSLNDVTQNLPYWSKHKDGLIKALVEVA